MRHIGIVILLFLSTIVYSQKGTIRATVYDDNTGETLVGVSVVIKGTYTGTSTDLDGHFILPVDAGTYDLQVSFISFDPVIIKDVVVTAGQETILKDIRMGASTIQLQDVMITARALRNTEAAIQTIKRNSTAMVDGISASKMGLIGDATAVEAAKRVTGVTIEGGKYIYVRGLGDRYSKTTLNGMEIPGLDPDRNSLQMDIFPTNLIENMVVSKNFTADMPADFTGGLINVETKDFPETKVFDVSVSVAYNPDMHFNSDYLTYDGGKFDFLGFDDGSRALPSLARNEKIPVPYSGYSTQEVTKFIKSFNNQLGAQNKTSFMDYSAGISMGNQWDVGSRGDGKMSYIFSLSYKSDTKFYDDMHYGEYQKNLNPDVYEMRYATVQNGMLGEKNVLVGALGGLAYKNNYNTLRLTAMRLQNGESRAARLNILNSADAVGQSGYEAESDNLEYNQRSLTNILLNGTHNIKDSGWDLDWRISPTFSTSDDPDIRKTAFTFNSNGTKSFSAGAGGNPSRIWRELTEINLPARLDVTKAYKYNGKDAKLKFGLSHIYKKRDYEILFFDIQFAYTQVWDIDTEISSVLDDVNLFPNRPNGIYYQSGNNTPNPNQYTSNVNNSGLYVSNEFYPLTRLKTIVGLRAENFVQRHTGRDQSYASGDKVSGRNLDNEEVLNSFDLFPSVNLIYEVRDNQNLRASYARTIARPSFKELSFAQILDPISNSIFNGSLFQYSDWDGNLTQTLIDNMDIRWEYFMEQGQNISASVFYKQFDNPIEMVRIPEQQTSTEYQPRNVGDASLMGFEFEFNRSLSVIAPTLQNFSLNGNLTLVKSEVNMTDAEYNSRKAYEKNGENVSDRRDMAGQSPYVINAGFVYGDRDKGVEAGLFYNVKGKTLSIVGAGLFPDIYVAPFHSVNFSFKKKLGQEKNTGIDFKISNILGEKYESYYDSYNASTQVYNSYSPGRSFSIGLSHSF